MLIAIALASFVVPMTGRTRTLIGVLIGLELLLLAAVVSLLSSSLLLDDQTGTILVCYVITLAGAETSCALALIVSHYRSHGSVYLD